MDRTAYPIGIDVASRIVWVVTIKNHLLCEASKPVEVSQRFHFIPLLFAVFVYWRLPSVLRTMHSSFNQNGMIRDYGLAALAYACAHLVLANRAKDLGALDFVRKYLERCVDLFKLRHQMARTVFARLDHFGLGEGDLEEGGDAEYVGHGKLLFYRFKWGITPSMLLGLSPRECKLSTTMTVVFLMIVRFVMHALFDIPFFFSCPLVVICLQMYKLYKEHFKPRVTRMSGA